MAIATPANRDQYGPLMTVRARGADTKTHRKFLRIAVENRGRSMATNCRATLTFIKAKRSCSGPTREDKRLRWEPGEMEVNIPPGSRPRVLDVAFSDSTTFRDSTRMCGQQQPDDLGAVIHAYVSTPDSVGAMTSREQDGFCLGEFEVEVTVGCDEGKTVTERFILRATAHWQEFSLRRKGEELTATHIHGLRGDPE